MSVIVISETCLHVYYLPNLYPSIDYTLIIFTLIHIQLLPVFGTSYNQSIN